MHGVPILCHNVIMPHTLFSQKEIKYLMSQRLARIATASISSQKNRFLQPDVVPIVFDFDEEFIGGTGIHSYI